jgi:riboflavin kinase/FMN adenylyltransferase
MVFHFSEELPSFKKAVITIGSFDGVHHGHKKILKTLHDSAKAIGGESILITFDPHPRKIIHPEVSLGLLCTPEEKYKLIINEGIDHIIVVPFSRDFSMLSATDYVHNFLVKHFNPSKIIIGYDHKFGHSREGDIALLKSIIPEIEIEEIAPQLIDDATVSSTKIRKALLSGNVKEASDMLERNYTLTGTVIHGKKLGRTIGFPTANININHPDVLIPSIGVYAVIVQIEDKAYKGMLNIGINPTVSNEQQLHIEVNILDFWGDIYGQNITLYFIDRLRNEQKFNSIDALISQLHQDQKDARNTLSTIDTANFLSKNSIFL